MKSLRLLKNLIIFSILLICANAGYGQIAKGHEAPVFNLRNTNGELVKPFQASKPVIISFFFTDCPNCRSEIKELETLNQNYNDKISLFLVGTSFKKDVEVSEDVDSFIKELSVSFTPLVDKYKDVIKSYGVTNYPSLFLIDSKGKVVFTSNTYNEKTIKELEKQIKSVK